MNVLLLLTLTGQCGSGGCPAPSFPAYAPAYAPAYVRPAPPITVVLGRYRVRYQGLSFVVEGELAGNGVVTWDSARPFNGRSLAAAQAADKYKDEHPPTARPEPKDAAGIPNYGLAPERMHGPPAYVAQSAEAQRFVRDAHRAGDEATKLHVTVVGSEADRARVVKDLNGHPAFAGLRDNLLIQDYAPGEWEVDPALGFKADGTPTILVQTARGPADPRGGKVVLRTVDYSMGPEKLAEAIRKADPAYRPDKDPGPNGPTPSSPFAGLSTSDAALAATAVAALLLIARLPKKES